jgi:hypothetical protein
MSWVKRIGTAAVGMALCGSVVPAADISGVWVSNPSVCNKVFVEQGGKISFSDTADI